MEETEGAVALSIKQPWATLVVHGLKTMELRTWPTKRRGPVYIHAGKLVERAAEAWAAVPDLLRPFCELRGGVVGRATIDDCLALPDEGAFLAAAARHRAPVGLLPAKGCYGFTLSGARPLPFLPHKGNLFFFPVALPPPDGRDAPAPPPG